MASASRKRKSKSPQNEIANLIGALATHQGDKRQPPQTDRPGARRRADAGARRAIRRPRSGASSTTTSCARSRSSCRRSARSRPSSVGGLLLEFVSPDVGLGRADGQLRRHRTPAAAISAAGAGRRHHGRDPRTGRPQHVGEALQRPGRGARQLSQERISADRRGRAVEAAARACRARARHPARGAGARRRQPHAQDGGGAEGGDRARRADAAHRIHVEPLADAAARRPRGDGGNLQQFRPPDRDPLHDLARGRQPREPRSASRR